MADTFKIQQEVVDLVKAELESKFIHPKTLSRTADGSVLLKFGNGRYVDIYHDGIVVVLSCNGIDHIHEFEMRDWMDAVDLVVKGCQ